MTDTRRADFAARQRALGRRRWEVWVSDPERTRLKQRLDALRKTNKPTEKTA